MDESFGEYRGFGLTVRLVHPGWWNGWALLDRPSRAGDGAVSRTGFFAEEVSVVRVNTLLKRRIDQWHSVPSQTAARTI